MNDLNKVQRVLVALGVLVFLGVAMVAIDGVATTAMLAAGLVGAWRIGSWVGNWVGAGREPTDEDFV